MNKDEAKMISTFEQSAAYLGEFAGMLAAYQNQLVQQGFQRPEALELVKDLQSILFSQTFKMGPPQTDEEDE